MDCLDKRVRERITEAKDRARPGREGTCWHFSVLFTSCFLPRTEERVELASVRIPRWLSLSQGRREGQRREDKLPRGGPDHVHQQV